MFLPRHNTPRLYCKAPPVKAALSVADKVDARATMFTGYGAAWIADWKCVLCWQYNAAEGSGCQPPGGPLMQLGYKPYNIGVRCVMHLLHLKTRQPTNATLPKCHLPPVALLAYTICMHAKGGSLCCFQKNRLP